MKGKKSTPASGARSPAARRRFRARVAPMLLLTASVALGACGKQGSSYTSSNPAGEPVTTFYGPQATIGLGYVRAYVTLDGATPSELGVAISEDGIRGLRTAGALHPRAFDEFLLSLPPEARGLPFSFVELDWNPAGHEPEGVYGVPHFDFHFYTISRAERDAIDAADPRFGEKAAHFPGREHVPHGYVAASIAMGVEASVAAVPRMGMHWVNPASPELNGKPFTHTMIYGSWDGNLTFLEPMVSRSFLESRPNVRLPIETAERYLPAGRYPDEYRIYWEPEREEYRVALTGFIERGS